MNVIGHEMQRTLLTRAVGAGRLAHGLCFSGPDHVGKRTVALWLAGELLRSQDPEKHPDFSLVVREKDEKTGVPKHEISVEQMRSLRERLSQTSFFSGPKIAVIDEAETLSGAAANALLKTLEEPPGKCTLLLVTRAIALLPATIASRVQTLHFAPVSVATMVAGGIEERFAKLSAGRPGIALGLRDPETFEKLETDRAEFRELLSASVWKREKIIESWFGKKKAHAEGIQELEERLRLWRVELRERMLAEAGSMRDNTGAYEVLERLATLEELVRANANVRYALEATFLR